MEREGGTTITNERIISLYNDLLLNMATGDSDLYCIPDKLPLFHIRYPRKLKKKLKRCNLLK